MSLTPRPMRGPAVALLATLVLALPVAGAVPAAGQAPTAHDPAAEVDPLIGT